MDVVNANTTDCIAVTVIYFCIAAFELPITPLSFSFFGLSTISFLFQHLRSFPPWPCSVPPRQPSGVLVALLFHSMKALGSIPWWRRAFQCRVRLSVWVPSRCSGFPYNEKHFSHNTFVLSPLNSAATFLYCGYMYFYWFIVLHNIKKNVTLI